MILSDSERFPHPVLAGHTDDYPDGSFEAEVNVVEDPAGYQIEIEYTVKLSQPELEKCISEGAAEAGIMVTCDATYYTRFIPVSLAPGVFSFPKGSLMGRVRLRPLVVSKATIQTTGWQCFHSEFEAATFEIASGQILAMAPELRLIVEPAKLNPIESIFELAKGEALPAGTFGVALDEDKIKLIVASDIHQGVEQMRQFRTSSAVLLNSLYLPAIMQVLSALQDGSSSHEGKRWHNVFVGKCDLLGINPERADLLKDAQLLLDSPLRRIDSHKEVLCQ